MTPENFVDRRIGEELLCSICQSVPHYSVAVEHRCGAVFCLLCVEAWKNQNSVCPNCFQPWGSGDFDTSKVLIRILRKMQVHCTNPPAKSAVCSWTGDWEKLDDHLKSDCELRSVPCVYKCGMSVVLCDMELHWEKECPNSPTICPGCEKRLLKCDQSKHAPFCRGNGGMPLLVRKPDETLGCIFVQAEMNVGQFLDRCPEEMGMPDTGILMATIAGMGKILERDLSFLDYGVHANMVIELRPRLKVPEKESQPQPEQKVQ